MIRIEWFNFAATLAFVYCLGYATRYGIAVWKSKDCPCRFTDVPDELPNLAEERIAEV